MAHSAIAKTVIRFGLPALCALGVLLLTRKKENTHEQNNIQPTNLPTLIPEPLPESNDTIMPLPAIPTPRGPVLPSSSNEAIPETFMEVKVTGNRKHRRMVQRLNKGKDRNRQDARWDDKGNKDRRHPKTSKHNPIDLDLSDYQLDIRIV